MPPKPKFTKEMVLEAAMTLLRDQGEDALTARNLGSALGSSTRPLFTLWPTMEDLKHDLYIGPAMDFFFTSCDGYQEFQPAFKQLGLNIMQFATNEPNVFAFLFVNKQGEGLTLDEWSRSPLGEEATDLLARDFDLDREVASILFIENWLHCFSLCVLKVSGAVKLTDAEASASLTHCFMGTLSLAKAGLLKYSGVAPSKEGGKIDGEPVGDLPVVPV